MILKGCAIRTISHVAKTLPVASYQCAFFLGLYCPTRFNSQWEIRGKNVEGHLNI
jgi:hypothetical protein